MAELKTKENDSSVDKFLASVEHPVRREDAHTLRAMMEEVSGEPARMWGAKIVGFGKKPYTYASGRTGEWMQIGFSPGKSKQSLYLMCDWSGRKNWLENLGKHKMGKGCLYINKLADVDLKVLRKLVAKAAKS